MSRKNFRKEQLEKIRTHLTRIHDSQIELEILKLELQFPQNDPVPDRGPQTLSVSTAAEMLEKSPRQVRNLLNNSELEEAPRDGNRRMVFTDSVRRYLQHGG